MILPDGTVVSETSQSPGQLENHLQRPEIHTALRGTAGIEIRFSNTLKTNMMYVAVPIESKDQVIGVMRVAYSITGIETRVKLIQQIILLFTFMATVLAFIMSILVTNYAIRPLRELTDSVLNIAGGARLEISPTERTDEVGKLYRAFGQMSAQINNQITQLTEERGQLSAVLANMNDGILIIGKEGQVELINPAAVEIFGVQTSGEAARTLIEVVRSHQIVDLWKKVVLKGEQQVLGLETSPGRMFLQVIATPLGKSLPGSTLLIFQDLTRVRRLETVRRDFISNVSHELRTPLASLKLLTETLIEGGLEDPPAARQFLLKIDAEIDNLTQMVRELLELSGIESGRVPLKKQLISPDELVNPAVERMRIQAERAGLTLTADCPQNLPKVHADPERLAQVLVNLIHNAIKFTHPGGQVHIFSYADAQQVVFAIRDTGVGIPASDLERIFERFYKADRSRSGGGTGLGLSISRHLVEIHGGKIWAESIPGKGSTFYFSLPAHN